MPFDCLRYFGVRWLAAAVLTLALGIGVNTAVFSVMNGYLLKPLPYPQGDRLIDVHVSVAIWQLNDMGVSKPLYARIKRRLKAASDSALYNAVDVDFQAKGSAQRLTGVEATGSLFQTLRVKPFLGHVFASANDQPGRDQVLVLSYRLWQRSFGGDPHVVGRGFTPHDTMKNRSVAVIDTRAAKMYFKNRNPIGRELKTSSSVRKVTIIGVVQAVTSERAVLVLSVVTLVACYLPARRAARLDPTEALQD